MKNALNYYYQFNIENIYLINNVFHFEYLNNNYIFIQYVNELDKLKSIYILNQELLKTNKYYHEIILTKDKTPFLIIDNKCYVLLKLSNVINDKISFYDLNLNKIDISSNLLSLVRFNWVNLWCDKVDYLEEIIRHSENKYLNLLPIFMFYIGLSENAISYINDSVKIYKKDYKDYLSVSHERIDINMKVSDLYNPLNIIIDHRVRDISEYIKSSFINNTYTFDEIEEYIYSLDLSQLSYSLLYGRLLFPSFFYDLCDKLLNNNKYETDIVLLGERIEEYRIFLKEIYYIIRKKEQITPVDWILK